MSHCRQLRIAASCLLMSLASVAPAYTAYFDIDGQQLQLPLSRVGKGGNVWAGGLSRSQLPRLLASASIVAHIGINLQPQGELPLQGLESAVKTALSPCYRL